MADLKLVMELKKQLAQQHKYNTALANKYNDQQKNQQVMITLAMYYADAISEYRAITAKAQGPVDVASIDPVTTSHLPMFPHFIPDLDFKRVWDRMLAGEGLGVSISTTGVTVHRVKPEQVENKVLVSP